MASVCFVIRSRLGETCRTCLLQKMPVEPTFCTLFTAIFHGKPLVVGKSITHHLHMVRDAEKQIFLDTLLSRNPIFEPLYRVKIPMQATDKQTKHKLSCIEPKCTVVKRVTIGTHFSFQTDLPEFCQKEPLLGPKHYNCNCKRFSSPQY